MPYELTACIERIVQVENTGTEIQRKVVLPNNSTVLAFWSGARDGVTVVRPTTRCQVHVLEPATRVLVVRLRPWVVSPDQTVARAIEWIEATKGLLRVEKVALGVYCSRRNLERKFRDAAGLSPKQYLINRRFHQALGLLCDRWEPADIADACGYYDTSHFAREVRSLMGAAPDKVREKLCRVFPAGSPFLRTPLRYTLIQ